MTGGGGLVTAAPGLLVMTGGVAGRAAQVAIQH